MQAGDVVARGVRALQLREDLVEVEVLRVDDARVRRGVGEDLGRDDRAGIEADRAARDEPLRAQRERRGRRR